VYEFLEGQVAGRTAARLVLDVHGVGYELYVPLAASFPASGTIRVWTHLVVREDSQQLFGFRDAATRDVFRALLTVSGVGPKVALAVLSGLSREDLLAALSAGDVARLTTVRGVGRKTAEQILLDLRDKVAVLQSPEAGAPPAARSANERRRQVEDAVAALISIGYSEKEARKQVERASREVDASDLELLVRTALQA
jgi:holliday junction DNA helicase RuvA